MRAVALFSYLVLACAACSSGRNAAVGTRAARPPIVLITIDTLRADRLGSYGSTRGLTPSLDAFAREATRFTAATSQVPLTLPSHATILTGLHPARHGVRTNDGFRLSPLAPTLAAALKSAGYATAAFVGGYPLRRSSGLSRGFDRYDDEFLNAPGAIERSAGAVVESAEAWIDRNAAQPFFAWIHLFDPHSPYTPPAPFAAAHRGSPYDGEVAYTDAAVGRFLDHLRQRDLFAAATIVVVADHGESLGEHGERTHGTFLYDATIRVPLLIKRSATASAERSAGGGAQYARLKSSRSVDAVTTPVETADLAPTIAAIAGATLDRTDGRSLLPLIDGAAGDPDRAAYAESYYQNVLLGWSPLRAVRTARWKLVEAPRPELYDLEHDPGELQNRLEERAAVASGLQRALRSLDSGGGATGEPPAAARESAERLRSLGYASGSTAPTAASGAIDPKDRIAVWAAIEDGIDLTGNDAAAAEQKFTRALQLDPGNGLALKYLGDLRYRAGRLRDARDLYQRAIAAGFRHADVHVNLAAIAEREGHLDEARDVLASAVGLNASDADAWNRLGLVEARRNDLDAARRAFNQAIATAADRAEPYYNLGVVERRAGNEAAAQSRLQDAIARNPTYAEAHYELGTGYLLARQPERALAAYRAALASRPDYAEALFGAARAELDLGKTADARRDYERFVEVAPKEYSQQIAAARAAINSLPIKN
jgi:arylsulfatase A-like enzyme/Tfp pilus assembly protein PilF